jgi:streptogramin lyase
VRATHLSVLVVILLAGAIVAGSYVLLQIPATPASTSEAGCADLSSVNRVVLNESQFGSVTTFSLPAPLRSPNSITSAPDGSVWFGEVAVPGLAHLFLNGTLVEYPWPFPNATPASLCFDRSEIWGVTIWNGLVWASDPANNQLVGMNQTTGAFTVVHLSSTVVPRFLAIGPNDQLWFTETSPPGQVGVISNDSAPPTYYSVPADEGEYTTSVLFQDSSLAYVVTVNPADNHGQVFSFDPSAPAPVFQQVGGNQTLLGPYSVAVSQGSLWVGEHEASYVAAYSTLSLDWSFYPTSTDPKLPLTLPYYLLANGSSVWFNEHDANRVAVITNETTLTEYAMSPIPIDEVGIGNALTIALDRNLVWFTAWTANKIGFVNDSTVPSFAVSTPANATSTPIALGSSAQFQLQITGTSSRALNITFADSESISGIPKNISFSSSITSIPSLGGPVTVNVTVSVAPSTPLGEYLLLMTVTDGLTSRSVYVPVLVS